MKLTRSITIATVLGATLALSACTQAVAPSPESPNGDNTSQLAAGPSGGQRPEFAAMRAQRFQQVDKDADGKVTVDEIRAAATEKFAQADTNHDGMLDASELSAMSPGFGRHRMGPDLGMLDTNGDGKVSADEFVSHAAARWQHADANGDGVVTLQEWEAQRPGWGQRGQGQGRHGRFEGARGGGGPMMEAMFQRADADHDGKVTRAEMEALRAQMFAQADTNHDGKLDQAELAAMRAAHGGERMAERFAQLDRDGDGKISKDEAPPRMTAMFDQADTDHDGKLTLEEWKAALPVGQERAERPGAPQGARGRGPMAMMDKDGDGTISAQEFSAMPEHWFDVADANHDGVVTLDELRAARPGPMRR